MLVVGWIRMRNYRMRVWIDLDDIDMKVAEIAMGKLRKEFNQPELEIEQFLLYCVKRILYEKI